MNSCMFHKRKVNLLFVIMSRKKEDYLKNYLLIMEAFQTLHAEKLSEMVSNINQMMEISWEAVNEVGACREIVDGMSIYNIQLNELKKAYDIYLSLQKAIVVLNERKS